MLVCFVHPPTRTQRHKTKKGSQKKGKKGDYLNSRSSSCLAVLDPAVCFFISIKKKCCRCACVSWNGLSMFSIYIHIKNVEFTGSRGFSSGSGFGFNWFSWSSCKRQRHIGYVLFPCQQQYTCSSDHALFPYTHIRSYSSYTHFFHFFSIPFLFSLTFNNYIYYLFFFNEDVEVNELEDLRAD